MMVIFWTEKEEQTLLLFKILLQSYSFMTTLICLSKKEGFRLIMHGRHRYFSFPKQELDILFERHKS